MTTWSRAELDKIGKEDELDIASLKMDGSLRKRVTIWVVRIGEDIFVRAFKGRGGLWFRWTQERHEGRIWCAGIEKDVQFVDELDPAINDRIDAEFRSKYGHYAAEYVDPMLTEQARGASIKLVPR
jgi:hypothetical protein